MTLVSQTADKIKTVIELVPDRGVVYTYDPFPAGEINDFVALLTTEITGRRVVRAWTIKNVGRDTVPISIASGSEVQRPVLRWLLRFFLAVEGNAETTDVTFRDLLEQVTEQLNAKRTLMGAPSILDHDPADYSLPNNGALLSLGDVVCHYGEVTFASTHEIVVTVS
jgi:hypothetical protein